MSKVDFSDLQREVLTIWPAATFTPKRGGLIIQIGDARIYAAPRDGGLFAFWIDGYRRDPQVAFPPEEAPTAIIMSVSHALNDADFWERVVRHTNAEIGRMMAK